MISIATAKNLIVKINFKFGIYYLSMLGVK
jgi:hypothetical protein